MQDRKDKADLKRKFLRVVGQELLSGHTGLLSDPKISCVAVPGCDRDPPDRPKTVVNGRASSTSQLTLFGGFQDQDRTENPQETCTATSLDIYGHILPRAEAKVKQRKRLYSRLRSGLRRHRGERLRFMTVTTSDRSTTPINADFNVLVKRIKRMTPLKLYNAGYLSRSEVRKFYPGKAWSERLKFHPFKVQTSEGNGVIHALFFGDYVPQAWLSDQWSDIHKSPIVDIRATKKKVGGVAGLANYVMAQYVGNQDQLIRYSWSSGWIFPGFVKIWTALVKARGLSRALQDVGPILDQGLTWFQGIGPPSKKDMASGSIFGYSERESEHYRLWRGVYSCKNATVM